MAKRIDVHEVLHRSAETKVGGDRSFGFVFTAFFAIVGLWPLIHGDSPRGWSIALAVAFLLAALIRPILLAPLNRAWMAFGRLLHSVTTPIILGFLFLAVVTPTALLMRLLRKVPLQLRFDSAARSYWIQRTPPGPAPDSMNRQF